MRQNKNPMKIEMVSGFVSDPIGAFAYYTEVLGFDKVMYSPESYIAIVKSLLEPEGTSALLEPIESGRLEISRKYKKEL